MNGVASSSSSLSVACFGAGALLHAAISPRHAIHRIADTLPRGPALVVVAGHERVDEAPTAVNVDRALERVIGEHGEDRRREERIGLGREGRADLEPGA